MKVPYLIGAALLGVSLSGVSLTTISGTITDGVGSAITGSCSIVPFVPFASGPDSMIAGPPVIVPITAGVFLARLAPPTNAQAGGQFYTMKCSGTTASGSRRSWGPQFLLIPASSTPLALNDVIVDLPSPTNFSMKPMQVYAYGLNTGVYGFNVVDGHVTGLTLCSTAPAISSLAALSNSILLALSNDQLLSMSN